MTDVNQAGFIDQIRSLTRQAAEQSSQAELCRLTGIPRASMCRFLSGTDALSASNLDALAAGLGLRVEENHDRTNPVNPNKLRKTKELQPKFSRHFDTLRLRGVFLTHILLAMKWHSKWHENMKISTYLFPYIEDGNH